jgi:glutamate synthase domain-containing protein 3
MVDLELLTEKEDIEEVQALLHRHVHHTGSTVADRIVKHWQAMEGKFVKVIPKDYKRAMKALKRAEAEGIPWEQAVMAGAHG